MIKEGSLYSKNEVNEITQKKEYSEEEITERLSQRVSLDNDFALYLLGAQKQELLVENLNKFQSLNQETALALIEKGYIGNLVKNLDNFQDLGPEIALKLIDVRGGGGSVARNLDKFQNLNQEIALLLIKKGGSDRVSVNLDKFQDVGLEIVLKLIEKGCGDGLVKNLDKLQNINHQEIALALIEERYAGILIKHLDKFQNINHQEIALKLINIGVDIISDLDKFQNINHQEIALKSIERGFRWSLVKNLDKFQNLNTEIALLLIDTERDNIISNLDKFQNINYQEIALKLIKKGFIWSVVKNLDKFQNLNQEMALLLIGQGFSNRVFVNSDKFQYLGPEIALELLGIQGGGGSVVKNLDKFQNLNQEVALLLIKRGYKESLVENLDKFQLSPQAFYQAVKAEYSDFISEIEAKIPKLAEQLSKSVELLLDVLNIKDNFNELEKSISSNPFLLNALEDNPRYGSKLILKYQEFDETAQNNIQALFNNEAEILKDNPNIDKDSVEFRLLMQERLVSHASNQEIIAELQAHDVNTKEWLNYDKQTYFTLGESEDVKFSDQIKTPITRIQETLNKYQDSIIKTLSYYKTELQAAFIPNPESAELQQKIVEQKTRIAAETDEKRAQGMQKGLASLEAKEAVLKPASVWSKVQSDIFRLKSMIDNIFKFHDACITAETKIETTKDRKELIQEKDSLEKNKTQLRDNFKEFELFFDSYESKLQELIMSSLGQDRSEALLQEIKETIGEELNHYDTDKNTLKNIFKDKAEDENKLKGREMKISIASRSTQNLYLGNYCPCCICIDSQHHGAESPIADYVTDLGMQNIVVYDEKTKAPVVTCWTFIGEYTSDGEPIMVIDNIEANTNYTINYPDQLKKVISKYINDYAKSANINTIIQGPYNNDLEVFPLSEIDGKLGDKYNRADGYFLEAERDEDEDEDDDDNDWEDQDDNEDNGDDDNV